jgi:hypothetical protein
VKRRVVMDAEAGTEIFSSGAISVPFFLPQALRRSRESVGLVMAVALGFGLFTVHNDFQLGQHSLQI